jgi:phage protein D
VGLKPTFRVLANSKDITDTIAARFISLSLTDETGVTSDLLEIVLADDPAQPIQKPPKGAELEVFLGYDGQAQRMGMFVCDEIEFEGWPMQMTIRARAAVFDKTPAGKADLQTQKTRSWDKGTKLGDMVAKIAKEHGMEPAVADSLKSIPLPHIAQSDESDLNLLVRLAKKYDGAVKPADGKLVLAKRGESKSVSGQSLASISLTPASGITSFHVTEASKDDAGTVVAYYHETKQAKRHEVKVGKGEPVRRLKQYQPTKDMALALAKAELARRSRGTTTVTLNMPGRPDVAAECPLNLSEFRDGVDGDYVITRVAHTLDKDGGYKCRVEAELPNDKDAPDVEDETGDDGA